MSNMVKVVEHLSKTVKKLKSEAEFLKKSSPSNVKYMELLKECKSLKKTRDEMQDILNTRASQDTQQEKLEAENTKLRRHTKRASDDLSKSQASLAKLSVENASLRKDILSLQKTLSGLGYTDGDADAQTRDNTLANSANHAECGREIAELKRSMKERDDIIQTLMNPSHNLSEKQTAEIRRLEREIDSWKARVATLNSKLEALKTSSTKDGLNHEFEVKRATEAMYMKNQTLVDELDDIRYNYQDCLRQNIRQEQTIEELRSGGRR